MNDLKDLQKALNRAAKAKVLTTNYSIEKAIYMQLGNELLASIHAGEVADPEAAVAEWRASAPKKPRLVTVKAAVFEEVEEP